MDRNDRISPSLDRWLHLPAESLLTLLKGSCRLCMSNLLPNNRISLFLVERNDVCLLQMANDLTGLQISDQSDYGQSMDCCLSCAGKLVNFYEFREHCHQNEKELNEIYTAMQLKLGQVDEVQHYNNTERDDSVSVPLINTIGTTQAMIDFRPSQIRKREEVDISLVKLEPHTDPLYDEDRLTSFDGLSKVQTVNPNDIYNRCKEFKCNKCPMQFLTIHERSMHFISKHQHKRGRPRLSSERDNCKYSGTSYDKHLHKYRHEKGVKKKPKMMKTTTTVEEQTTKHKELIENLLKKANSAMKPFQKEPRSEVMVFKHPDSHLIQGKVRCLLEACSVRNSETWLSVPLRDQKYWDVTSLIRHISSVHKLKHKYRVTKNYSRKPPPLKPETYELHS